MSGQSVNNDQPDRGTAPEATEPKAGSAELTTVEASAPPEAAQREAAEAEGKSENVLERLTSDLEDVRDLLRRKQAEFENFRKRVERERKDFIAYASANVITEILPVLDNLERAVEACEKGDRLREGVEIISRQLRDILRKAGLREVEAEGARFDPHVHEAVGRIETSEHPEGTVLNVLRKGYFLKDRLLRAALVNVAQKPGEERSKKQEVGSDASQS